MRKSQVIAYAKRDQNLFTLDLALPGQVMSVRTKAMAIAGQGRPTHLVSQNKSIRLWHRRLAHASNARVVKTSKLVDGINLGLPDKEYNLAEVFIDSDDSEISDVEEIDSQAILPSTGSPAQIANQQGPPTSTASARQANDVLDKLCAPCMGSKSTRTVRQNKSMTPTTSKLEEVHADLWGPHNPPSQSGSVYAGILMCEHKRKT